MAPRMKEKVLKGEVGNHVVDSESFCLQMAEESLFVVKSVGAKSGSKPNFKDS